MESLGGISECDVLVDLVTMDRQNHDKKGKAVREGSLRSSVVRIHLRVLDADCTASGVCTSDPSYLQTCSPPYSHPEIQTTHWLDIQ
jgi:hypothetical protein